MLELLLSIRASTIYFSLKNDFGTVLSPSGIGDENHSINDPSIISIDGNTWAMIYTARSDTKREGLKYATSPKGQEPVWTKQNADGDYIVQSGTGTDFDLNIMTSTAIVKDGTFYIIYCTATGKVGLATGPDLDNLTKHGSNPIIDNTALGTFDAHIRHMNVIEKDGTYYLFYSGRITSAFHLPEKLGYATSTDLINWTRNPTPVYDPDSYPNSYATSSIANCLFKYEDKYYLVTLGCWYNTGGSQALASTTAVLVSDDLLTWNLINEILPYGSTISGFIAGINGTSAFFIDTTGKYTVDGKGSINGNSIKFNVRWIDYLADSVFSHNFPGTVIDPIWDTITPDSNGIIISQNEKLLLDSDGSETASAHSIIANDAFVTSNTMVVLQFDYERTQLSGGYSKVQFMGVPNNAGDSSYLAIERGTNTEIKLLWSLEGVPGEQSITTDYTKKYRFILQGSLVSFWYHDGSDWIYLHHFLGVAPTDFNFTWAISVLQANLSGQAVLQTVDNILVTEFNSNKYSPYL